MRAGFQSFCHPYNHNKNNHVPHRNGNDHAFEAQDIGRLSSQLTLITNSSMRLRARREIHPAHLHLRRDPDFAQRLHVQEDTRGLTQTLEEKRQRARADGISRHSRTRPGLSPLALDTSRLGSRRPCIQHLLFWVEQQSSDTIRPYRAQGPSSW